MKHTLILILLLILKFGFAIGQDLNFATVSRKGEKIQDFIPKGWELIDSVSGDLNKDGFADKVFIINTTEGRYSNEVILNKQTLVIIFYDTTAQHYKLKEQTSKIFNPMADHSSILYEVMEINKGVLSITFMHAGDYPTIIDYKFRYQNNDFYLIGADKQYSKPSDYKYYSFNFLSKKWSLTTGNDDSNEKYVTVWKKLELKELKNLKNFGGPFSWEVTKGVDL